ncbi:MAG TPA: rhomboid family intramembrane serine protease [Mycobacteriales bacterium]|nr:rhomboid family intramembrane serine protease [Mycobacteriales bacterium]
MITVASGGGLVRANGGSDVYRHLALIPAAVAGGEWWRLFSSAFLHFGITHIVFNMLALWFTGPALEAVLGKLRFLVLYVLAGVGGGLLSVAIGPLNETAAGASGAIFGLFAAFYVIARHRNVNTQQIMFTIVMNLVLTFSISNIDWRGHVGGLIVGAAVAAAIAFAPRGPRNGLAQAGGVAVIAVLLAAGGLLAVHHDDNRCRSAFDQVRAGNTNQFGPAAYCSEFDRGALSAK